MEGSVLAMNDDPRSQPDLPPVPPPNWLARLDIPFVLVIVLVAWSFGGYMNSNWVIQSQGDRISAQSARITELHAQVNQHAIWMREIQDEQKKQNTEAAAILSQLNLQLAEIKGATTGKRK